MKAPAKLEKVFPITDPAPASIDELVRARAYELFEARGRESGHELEDWLRAEEEIRTQSRASAA